MIWDFQICTHYGKMGCPQMPTPQQTELLKEVSKPKEKNAEFAYDNGYIAVEISLSANEINRMIIRE